MQKQLEGPEQLMRELRAAQEEDAASFASIQAKIVVFEAQRIEVAASPPQPARTVGGARASLDSVLPGVRCRRPKWSRRGAGLLRR